MRAGQREYLSLSRAFGTHLEDAVRLRRVPRQHLSCSLPCKPLRKRRQVVVVPFLKRARQLLAAPGAQKDVEQSEADGQRRDHPPAVSDVRKAYCRVQLVEQIGVRGTDVGVNPKAIQLGGRPQDRLGRRARADTDRYLASLACKAKRLLRQVFDPGKPLAQVCEYLLSFVLVHGRQVPKAPLGPSADEADRRFPPGVAVREPRPSASIAQACCPLARIGVAVERERLDEPPVGRRIALVAWVERR